MKNMINAKRFKYGLFGAIIIATFVFGGEILTYAANPGDVIINEIMQNPSAVSDSAGEWFELFNPTDSDIDIDGWTIEDNDFDSHVINNGGPLIIPAGGFLVLGNNGDPSTNGGVIVAYEYGAGWFLSNGADEVVLLDENLTEINRVEYDGGPVFPDPNGASMALKDPTLDNGIGDNWCTSSTPFGDGDLGTPGSANNCMELNEPPDCSQALPSIDTIWPPNHKFVPVTVLGVMDPHGDGHSMPDGHGLGTNTAKVRAERSGTKKVKGNGRVYHIVFSADDGMGGSCLGEVLVGVPHDKRQRGIPIDDGPLYDSTIP